MKLGPTQTAYIRYPPPATDKHLRHTLVDSTARRIHVSFAIPISIAAVFVLAAAESATGQLRARVIDAETRRPFIDLRVLIVGPSTADSLWVATDQAGFFMTREIQAGEYVVTIKRDGYALSETKAGVNAETLVTLPAILLHARAIPLDSISVRARPSRLDDPTTVGFVRASHLIAGDRIRQMENHGIRPLNAIRELGGVRVRQWQTPGGQPRWCVESLRRSPNLQSGAVSCEPVVLVWDGRIVPDIEQTLRSLHLEQLESIEYVAPAEAAFRYGSNAGAVGALAIWSRGLGPHK